MTGGFVGEFSQGIFDWKFLTGGFDWDSAMFMESIRDCSIQIFTSNNNHYMDHFTILYQKSVHGRVMYDCMILSIRTMLKEHIYVRRGEYEKKE